MEIKVIKLFLN